MYDNHSTQTGACLTLLLFATSLLEDRYLCKSVLATQVERKPFAKEQPIEHNKYFIVFVKQTRRLMHLRWFGFAKLGITPSCRSSVEMLDYKL
jgi:hypothetical protein